MRRLFLFKAAAHCALLALVFFFVIPASAATVFDLEFGCTPTPGGCNDGTSAGGGTISFPNLGPASPAAPFAGVYLDLTFLLPLELHFTESDIQSISWEISSDLSTLTNFSLFLDTDPTYVSGDVGEHQYASVSISMNQGTWYAASEGCDSNNACYTTSTYDIRTATASPAVVPIPATAWLFGSGLLGLIGVTRCKKAA